MRVDVIKLVILAFLIIISLGILSYTKTNSRTQTIEFEGFQVNDPLARDFDNKTLSDEQLYGDIPQAATISIFKKAELKGLTANPDAIPIADADSKGKGGGPELTVTEIPQQEIPPDDIETVLNEAIDAPVTPEDYVEEFSDYIEGFSEYDNIEGFQRRAPPRYVPPPPRAQPSASSVVNRAASVASTASTLAPGNADAARAAQALAIAANPQAAAKAKAAEEAAKLGIKLPVLPTYDTSTPQGAAANLLQQKAMDKGSLVLQKAKNAIAKRLKNTKLAKMAGKAVKKAKAVVMKGVKKVTQKLTGMFAKKVGAKIGAKVTQGIFKKMASKLATKITGAVVKAQATAAGLATNPITVAFGIVLTAISVVATAVGIALPIILKGDEGVCDPGWRKISDVWPSYLDLIPGIGDIMGVIAPYLCYRDGCEPHEDENAGLCYDKCDKGYHGAVTMCVANSNPSNAKAPHKSPCGPGLRDDGTSCWRDTLPNGVGTIPTPNPCPPGHRDDGTSCWNPLHCNPVVCDPLGWDGCKSRSQRHCTDWGWGRQTCVGGDCIGGATGGACRGGDCHGGDMSRTLMARGTTCGNKANVDGLCYNHCPAGYRFVGGALCEPHGGPGIKTTLMDRQYCPDADREMAWALTKIDQQCYTKCPADTPYRVPLMPYLCSAAKTVKAGKRGELTSTYDRGVGRPKLKIQMVKPTPPPPPPPSPTNSAAYADDPDTNCRVEFSDTKVLQEMCDFYYRAAVMASNVNPDGSIAFGYISKITKVIGSSEQSADILCDITNVVVNTDTGKTISTTVAAGSDRRFYFAKIEKICKFLVVGATNANGTGPDVKTAPEGDPKVLNFTPVIQKCVNIPIGLKKCQGQESINAMIEMYKKSLPPTVRIKSIDAVEDSGTDVCAVAWKEVVYDPATNVESAPTIKVGNFKYLQDKSNDACAYKLQSYSPGNPTQSIKALAKPVVYDAPLPPEVALQGCATTCKDPVMLRKLVGAFNAAPGSNRILSVSKVVTPSPLRCDIEADVFVLQTKVTEKQRIRFDLTKDQASCVFNVKTVGAAGSGTFIQSNTKVLDSALNTKDFITSSQTEAVKSAQTNLAAAASKITEAQGKANSAYESAFSQFGQVQTLGSCPKKCSDPDILNTIITHYNTVNYPKTRTGVTKKTIGRILKAGTANNNTCDILFEEKQEKYNDLYADTPTVNVTQKTQRFTMKDMGGCQFVVDSPEGFQGLPMAPRREGFQVTKVPSVVNTVTPSLNPAYTGAGCELDCTKAEVLTAMKQKYQSNNIEGFRNRKQKVNGGFFSNLFASFNEAFQDVEAEADAAVEYAEAIETGIAAEAAAEATAETPAETSEEAPADQGATDWNAAAEEQPVESEVVVDTPETPAKVVHTTNMKKVNRVLKLGNNKCEYEVVYDSTDTDSNGNTTEVNDVVGYFTAVFTKDKTGCSYLPSQVTKSTTPIISTVPNTRTANIAFSF